MKATLEHFIDLFNVLKDELKAGLQSVPKATIDELNSLVKQLEALFESSTLPFDKQLIDRLKNSIRIFIEVLMAQEYNDSNLIYFIINLTMSRLFQDMGLEIKQYWPVLMVCSTYSIY